MSSFERLLTSFRDEIRLWPPSEQSFDESVMKAKTHGAGTQNARLSSEQKAMLREIYEEARVAEMREKYSGKKRGSSG